MTENPQNNSQDEAKYFPLFFKLNGVKVLVVGGGEVARRKILQLLDYGAEITVAAPKITRIIEKLVQAGEIRWLNRSYQSPEAEEYALVIATTDNPSVNRITHRDAVRSGIPINVVDKPELCTVIFPSIIRREGFTLALSSGGKAPFFTRAMREKLENLLPGNLAETAQLAAQFRSLVMERCSDPIIKEKLFRQFLNQLEQRAETWSADPEEAQTEWKRWIEDTDAV